jgi:hypothetical protein
MMKSLQQTAFGFCQRVFRGFSVLVPMVLCVSAMASPFPTVPLSELPDPLRSVWKELKPEMTEMSHCAAAFDSHSDGEKMAFRCSIHIKMSAEGERRAMKYCEEKRAEKNIKSPCRLVRE